MVGLKRPVSGTARCLFSVDECSPKWANSVQYSACLNNGPIADMNGRTWKKHGKLPYIEYPAGLQLITAKLTTITAMMNGKETKLTSILHKNENYIRIRDLTDVQTDDNLSVNWDPVNNNVNLYKLLRTVNSYMMSLFYSFMFLTINRVYAYNHLDRRILNHLYPKSSSLYPG
jgi:hypothetical protein